MGRIIIPKGRPEKYHMLAHRGRGMDVQPNTRKHACTASMASVLPPSIRSSSRPRSQHGDATVFA